MNQTSNKAAKLKLWLQDKGEGELCSVTPIRARANAHDRAAYQRRTIQQRQQEADSQRERASQEIARRQEEDRINEAASNTGPGDEATQEEDDQPINAQQLNLVQDEDDENTLTLEEVHFMRFSPELLMERHYQKDSDWKIILLLCRQI